MGNYHIAALQDLRSEGSLQLTRIPDAREFFAGILGFRVLSQLPSADMGFPKLGIPFWRPYNKEYSVLASILGSPYFGK